MTVREEATSDSGELLVSVMFDTLVTSDGTLDGTPGGFWLIFFAASPLEPSRADGFSAARDSVHLELSGVVSPDTDVVICGGSNIIAFSMMVENFGLSQNFIYSEN